MVRTEVQKDPHVGDGTITIMQEHDRTSVPILYRLLHVCTICQGNPTAVQANCFFVISRVAVIRKICIETGLESIL